jgi:transposase
MVISKAMNAGELTTSQLAKELGVTSATARLWCRRGFFPNAYPMDTPRGVVWMIPKGDLEGFKPPKPTGRPPKPKDKADKSVAKKRVHKKNSTRLLKTLSRVNQK